MIKQLRKRHLQVWSLLALLIPVGIISAWFAIPKQQVATSIQFSTKDSVLPVLIRSIDTRNYTASLKTNNSKTAIQLEWINKSVLTNPSALIYELRKPMFQNIIDNDLIGRIDSKGTYHFNLKNDSNYKKNFVLYDIIHRQIIDTINF